MWLWRKIFCFLQSEEIYPKDRKVDSSGSCFFVLFFIILFLFLAMVAGACLQPTCLAFYVGAKDLSSDPLGCLAAAFPNKPPRCRISPLKNPILLLHSSLCEVLPVDLCVQGKLEALYKSLVTCCQGFYLVSSVTMSLLLLFLLACEITLFFFKELWTFYDNLFVCGVSTPPPLFV